MALRGLVPLIGFDGRLKIQYVYFAWLLFSLSGREGQSAASCLHFMLLYITASSEFAADFSSSRAPFGQLFNEHANGLKSELTPQHDITLSWTELHLGGNTIFKAI